MVQQRKLNLSCCSIVYLRNSLYLDVVRMTLLKYIYLYKFKSFQNKSNLQYTILRNSPLEKVWHLLNPFPHIDAFWHFCSRQLFENIATNEEIAWNEFSMFSTLFNNCSFIQRDFLCFCLDMFEVICCRPMRERVKWKYCFIINQRVENKVGIKIDHHEQCLLFRKMFKCLLLQTIWQAKKHLLFIH